MKHSGTKGRWFLVAAHGLVALVALAIADKNVVLFLTMIGSVAAASFALYRWFSDTPLFASSFASLAAVYASVFAFFLSDLFGQVPTWAVGIGFSIPILSFALGCWWQRREIRNSIEGVQTPDQRGLEDALLWLVPMVAVGAAVVGLSNFSNAVDSEGVFLATMALIGGLVVLSSRRIAVFLIEVALLFEQFTQQIARLALPAFAFLTVYALIVIVFAALYAVLSHAGVEAHFRVLGQGKALSFPEAIHFSITTLSTVGYGDIIPSSNMARALASIEVVSGVLLLLFGFSELMSYRRGRPPSNRN